MATTCNFGQIKDLRLKSLCMGSTLVIDNERNANFRDITTKNSTVRKDLMVEGDTFIEGSTIIEKELDVLGNATICGGISLKGNILSNLNLNQNLNVNQDAIICGDLIVKGNFDVGNIDIDILDANCGNISNVQALFVDQLFGKHSPINVEDELNITIRGKRITFEDNIRIGKNTLSAPTQSSNCIAIGNEALQNLPFNYGYGNFEVAIGDKASKNLVYAYYGPSVVIGGKAMENNTLHGDNVVIGYSAGSDSDSAYLCYYSVVIGSRSCRYGFGYRNVILGTRSCTYSGQNVLGLGGQFMSENTVIGYGACENARAGIPYAGGENLGYFRRNTIIGDRAGDTHTGHFAHNVVVGKCGLESGTDCLKNVAIGNYALQFQGAPYSVSSPRIQHNIRIGYCQTIRTRLSDVTGSPGNPFEYNISVGDYAWPQTGSFFPSVHPDSKHNVILGHNARGPIPVPTIMNPNPIPEVFSYNVMIGDNTESLQSGSICVGYAAKTDGMDAIAIGKESSVPSNYSISIGRSCCQYSTITGSNNLFIGSNAGKQTSGGSRFGGTIGIGRGVMYYATDLPNAIGIGTYALSQANGSAFSPAQDKGKEIAIGNSALYYSYGARNVAIGWEAMQNNYNGYSNVAIGWKPLKSITTGCDNISIGYRALYYATSGRLNIALGYRTSSSLISGQYTIAIGDNALYDNTADNNIAIGHFSGAFVTTGTYNVIIGYNAGNNLTSQNKNTILGSYADSSNDNAVALGYNAQVSGINGVVVGVESTALANCIVLGKGSTASGDGQFRIGSSTHTISTNASAGATTNWLDIWVNDTQYRIPLHALA